MVLRSSIHFAGWILAAAAAALSGCSQTETGADARKPPEIRLEGVRFRLFRGDALRAEGTASSAAYQRESSGVKAADLVVTMHDRGEAVVLTAPSGQGVVTARSFEAFGGLRATRGSDAAATESARFEPQAGDRGQVIGEQPVELSGRGYRMRGKGFTLDPTKGQIALRGGTRLVAGLGEGR